MSEWSGDPAKGCGLMLAAVFIVAVVLAALALAWVVSALLP